jgi:hypothetical protein
MGYVKVEYTVLEREEQKRRDTQITLRVSIMADIFRFTGLLVYQVLCGAEIDMERANHGSSKIRNQARQHL